MKQLLALLTLVLIVLYGCARSTEEAANPGNPAAPDKAAIAVTPAGMQTVTLRVEGMT